MMADKKCCFGCTERHYLCWSSCGRHKDAKAERDAEQAVIRTERAKLNDVDGFFVEAKIKTIKRMRDR